MAIRGAFLVQFFCSSSETLRGRKDTLAKVYFYWGDNRPPRPPRDRRHWEDVRRRKRPTFAADKSNRRMSDNDGKHRIWSAPSDVMMSQATRMTGCRCRSGVNKDKQTNLTLTRKREKYIYNEGGG